MAIVMANSAAELDQQIHDAGDKLVVVMFTSDTCAACRNINPKVTQFAKEYGNRLKIIKVDVNQKNDLAQRYHIHLLPTFLFMRYGRSVDKFSGADGPMLNNKINTLLKK